MGRGVLFAVRLTTWGIVSIGRQWAVLGRGRERERKRAGEMHEQSVQLYCGLYTVYVIMLL